MSLRMVEWRIEPFRQTLDDPGSPRRLLLLSLECLLLSRRGAEEERNVRTRAANVLDGVVASRAGDVLDDTEDAKGVRVAIAAYDSSILESCLLPHESRLAIVLVALGRVVAEAISLRAIVAAHEVRLVTGEGHSQQDGQRERLMDIWL